MTQPRHLAVIPARGGSKRIPRKNVLPFAGKPMIAWSIEAALESQLFDRVVVSTDDAAIAALARSLGADVPFERPAALSDDHAGTLEVVAHATDFVRARGDAYTAACCIYATAPFVTPASLRVGAETIADGTRWDYCIAAARYSYPVQRSFTRDEGGALAMLFPEHVKTRSQDLPAVFHDAGQFYWGRLEAWTQRMPILGPRSTFVELPVEEVQDIDTADDWRRAEELFALRAAGRRRA